MRHRRLELALRIDDAAHACGVAANVFSRLENGGAVGSDRLLRVLTGLGLIMLVTTKNDALKLAPSLMLPTNLLPGQPRSTGGHES